MQQLLQWVTIGVIVAVLVVVAVTLLTDDAGRNV